MNNVERIGNFTSSQISRLLKQGRKKGSWGAAALTYIEEKKIERKMGRSLDTDAYSQAMAWGKFMEMIVFNRLGTDYVITSLDTDVHPRIKYWAGSKDFHKMKNGKKYCIGDIKCFQPKKFAQYTECLEQKNVQLLRENFADEYWQLVSNAIINGVRYAEAISFMPYAKDMKVVREAAADYSGPDQWMYRFIYEKSDSALAVLPNNSKYKDLTKFEFKIPAEDVMLLTKKVEEAGELLIT